MISCPIRQKLLRIIKEEMIPEYKKLENYREDIKNSYLNYLDTVYLTEKDRELIGRYPEFTGTTDELLICRYYDSFSGLSFKRMNVGGYDISHLKIPVDSPILKIYNSTLVELRNENKEAWKIIGGSINKYCRTWNSYVEKYNMAIEFLMHKNTTITLIKNEFPELYKLYKQ